MIVPNHDLLQRLGRSLREIDPSMLHPDPEEGPVRWFQGEAGTEITAWTDANGKPHHVQLVFTRVSVEWSVERGLLTGAFDKKGSTAGGRYDPYLLQVGAGIDPDVCRAALIVIEASDISADVREPLRTALIRALTPDGREADERS